jgi:exodeoxyribonuclease V gamma subunit
MSAERAAMRLSRLMALWLAGMHAPLPTHPDFAFDLLTASAQRPEAPDGPDAVAALLADDALRRRWEERHEQLCERSPLLAREFPTLAALVEHPDFVAHSLALYADILDGVVDASEADA